LKNISKENNLLIYPHFIHKFSIPLAAPSRVAS
jgi:hypothetical protein